MACKYCGSLTDNYACGKCEAKIKSSIAYEIRYKLVILRRSSGSVYAEKFASKDKEWGDIEFVNRSEAISK